MDYSGRPLLDWRLDLKRRAAGLPSIQLTPSQFATFELVVNGAYAPIRDMAVPIGTDRVLAIRDATNIPVGIVEVNAEGRGTIVDAHLPQHPDYPELRLPPTTVRERLAGASAVGLVSHGFPTPKIVAALAGPSVVLIADCGRKDHYARVAAWRAAAPPSVHLVLTPWADDSMADTVLGNYGATTILVEPPSAAPVRLRRGFCVWFTGLPSSGKSTIADQLAIMLEERGRRVSLLDGDVVRMHLSKGLGFSREDRDTNIRRIGFVAAEIVRHDGVAITAAVSPYESTREDVRRMVGEEAFVLAYVATPQQVCEDRDAKGFYAKARAGEIKGFTGVDDPYEAPTNPSLTLETTGASPQANARRVIEHLQSVGLLVVESAVA